MERMLPEKYNLLLGVNEANSKLWSDEEHAWSTIFSVGGQILSRGYGDAVCLRLLHKHYQITPESIVLEYEGKYQNIPALISEMLREDEYGAKALPSVISSHGGDIRVAEHAAPEVFDDPSRIKSVIEDKDFLSSASQILADSGLDDVLGIGFWNKRFYRKGAESMSLVEVSDEEKNQNIVRWTPNTLRAEFIQTLWAFKTATSDPITSRFIPTRISRSIGCVPDVIRCVEFVRCVKYSPGHAEEKTHLNVASHKPF